MIRFECDYAEGCHPDILRILQDSNLVQTPGYGLDDYCDKARTMIRDLCGIRGGEVQFLVGGTQTNATVIESILRPYQGVLCCPSAHIATHETGAVEHSGHKVLTMGPDLAARMNGGSAASEDLEALKLSKITARMVQAAYDEHWNDETHEHMVQPGMVYISHPSENGALYTKEELSAISRTCRKLGLPLYLDGARLGYGLAAEGSDVTLKDIAKFCDVFYIGGTKCGALFGEAVVFPDEKLAENFRYNIKMCGGMLAKGRLLGIQFCGLLEKKEGEPLYIEIGRSADRLAYQIRDTFKAKQIPFLIESVTNQQFPVLTKKQQSVLEKDFSFSPWAAVSGDADAVRFATSWATKAESVNLLTQTISHLEQ
ncbi:MAG: beta-eliminating lyase-related protein [Treponema sp.]|jgi:threonine aldolase|nr:beta-eliminating lyase-related protein [Treponema sp.]